MKLAIFLLAVFPLNASAFLFGGISDKKSEEMLLGMEANFNKGDCRAVDGISEELFREKPSSAIREKAYSYMGRCYESQQLPDKAIAVYKLAYGLYPESDLFSARLAAIYLKTGFYALAAPLFEQSLKVRSDDIEANTGLARCYAAMGFLSKAKVYYSKAAILGGFGDLAFLKEYTAQMLRKRDWEEAELIARYSLKLAPGDAAPHEALARAAAGRGDYKTAAAHMRDAVKLDPAGYTLALELALTEFLAGNYDAALAASSMPKGENDALAFVVRGMILKKKGDSAGALEYFEKASKAPGRPFIAAFAAALIKEAP